MLPWLPIEPNRVSLPDILSGPGTGALLGYDERATDAGGFHAKFDPGGALKDTTKKQCSACHWHEFMGFRTLPGAGTKTEQIQRGTAVGNELSDYPGGAK